MIYKKYSGFHYTPPIPFELTNNQQILLMPIGDIHFGVKDFPAKHFVTTMKWASDRGATFLGMGEYLDFTSKSQRPILAQLRESQLETIDEWVQDKLEELFDMISFTRGRWLGLLEGDHRWTFETGISGDQYFADKLACDFLGTSALLRLDAGVKEHPEADTILYCHHGVGGGSSAGGHLNAVEKKLKDIEADIYLFGHSHAKIGTPLDRQYITPDGIHYHRTKLLARTGSFYKTCQSMPPLSLDQPAISSRGTYAEQRGYSPSTMGAICIGIGHENVSHSDCYRPTIHFSL
jgi:hypothetical protein